jgi:hypothetical protein
LRAEIRHVAVHLAAHFLAWLFSIRPAVPAYCRCTPTDQTPYDEPAVTPRHSRAQCPQQAMINGWAVSACSGRARVPEAALLQTV